ncbi:hypothetical protein GUJ93_ZPchr0012g19109 [Zizania palustris]|uniref:Uncharacterized protein n=1 Tax=Zizania palustris TaxID=103762 RepID=A0A8J5WTY5_ZIZPA|nr:hypothetical protein GUJ93_ZPchr0012g19109 [Zizania palustris]
MVAEAEAATRVNMGVTMSVMSSYKTVQPRLCLSDLVVMGLVPLPPMGPMHDDEVANSVGGTRYAMPFLYVVALS